MDNRQFDKYNSIPASKFAFASGVDTSHDQKLDTKPVGYFKDAMRRFSRNKASVVAAYIILFLVIFALVGPYLTSATYQNAQVTDSGLMRYKFLPPKLFNAGLGFWDGSESKEMNQANYYRLLAMQQETGHKIIIGEPKITTDTEGNKMYTVRYDAYTSIDNYSITVTLEDYQAIMAYQDEHNVQIILPAVNRSTSNKQDPYCGSPDVSVWYECKDQKGIPTFVKDENGNNIVDENGNYVFNPAYVTRGFDLYTSEMRLDADPGKAVLERYAHIEDEEERTAAINADPEWATRWRYAARTGSSITGFSYVLRVSQYEYFQYLYDFEPRFVFGTNAQGYDIFSRLAKGARFSFIFAIVIAAINLTIGAIYGAIAGYYGGVADLVMERITDILGGIPSTVTTILFNLHLAKHVGVLGALVFAFILTGWIGMASSVRRQFYRFKNQEYVLAARTLGAKDWRIIWKHIFPNSLGTLVTGSVLVIPGVIMSETSLTYLGIINLDSPTMSSIGSMLSAGQEGGAMTHAPHVIFFPALFIALLMICFNLFGNGLRDAFNPSLRGTEE
ncbi:MAG: ABC transporter permease [Clostridia bacterium]|nr:ABC transporter permease [Clostridia bacterium]MBQ7914423.1 ABC transporter permease [Clostridia bacterium]MBQ8771653.1 ABC transporter permease [Clostridia bacterium]